ncbi:MAG: tRNA lysidine(34) synthetase TilS [Clostridiales Family XIII bacterium]|jgi:tRNA(Ile)-lysidine synthase|nr:tRNA lysidine(34) synthetase TilS [Clostridiales Family XIII bacterium]
MIEKARRFIAQNALIPEEGAVVLGISGGPDSVCLLHLLLEMKAPSLSVVCAHVNHGLRGEESDEDERFVFTLCERLGVPFELMRIDASKVAEETGMGVEEAGRAVRYAFFDEVAEKLSASSPGGDVCIALAHNRDDQVETVLMRILRGTGTDGLAGIPVRRAGAAGFPVVRPLLDTPRWEIEMFLAERGIAFRLDSSNDARDAFRNRIRLDLLPQLEEESGGCVRQSLLRLARNAAEDRDYFEQVTGPLLEGWEHSLPAEALAGLHPAVRHRVIVKAFARLGLTQDIGAVHLAAADKLLHTATHGGAGGKRVEFPRDYTLGIERGQAVFRPPDMADPAWGPRRTSGKSR